MSYITMSDLGQDSATLSATAAKMRADAGALWTQAQNLQDGSPGQQNLLAQAQALGMQADALDAQAASTKAQESSAPAPASTGPSTSGQVLDLFGKLATSFAPVGGAALIASQQPKTGLRPTQIPISAPTPSYAPPQSSGMNLVSVVALVGVGGVVLAGLAYLVLRPQQPVVIQAAPAPQLVAAGPTAKNPAWRKREKARCR